VPQVWIQDVVHALLERCIGRSFIRTHARLNCGRMAN
jgi:hypothetical protein